MDIQKELIKVAKEVSEFDEKQANEILDAADAVEPLLEKVDNVAEEVDSLESKVHNKVEDIYDELDDAANEIEEIGKTASLLNPGDKIVCLNSIQGVYKGRIYLLKEYTDTAKNYGVITELDGSPVGAYQISRFCLDNKEY